MQLINIGALQPRPCCAHTFRGRNKTADLEQGGPCRAVGPCLAPCHAHAGQTCGCCPLPWPAERSSLQTRVSMFLTCFQDKATSGKLPRLTVDEGVYCCRGRAMSWKMYTDVAFAGRHSMICV